MINIYTVIISGLFGLLVALLTTWVSHKREQINFERTSKKEEFSKIENLYIEHIAMLEKILCFVESQKDFSELFDEISLLNAKIKLYASEGVEQKSSEISDLIYEWSTEFARGCPVKVAGADYCLISSNQTPHREKAKELFPKLNDEILKLVSLMRNEINDLKEN